MKKARTLADIINHPFVESTHTENDGFREDDRPARWVYLLAGYISPDMECGTIHEGTVAECCELLNGSRRATLEEIERAGYTLKEAHENWAVEDGTMSRINMNIERDAMDLDGNFADANLDEFCK